MDSENLDSVINQPCISCSNEMVLLFGTALLLIILLAEFFEYGNFTDTCPSNTPCRINPSAPPTEAVDYGYEDYNGPAIWKCKYPAALGCRQSPINIMCKSALVCPISPLNWSCEYNIVPERLRIQNDGHCVMLHIKYPGIRPTLYGGPLNSNYKLYSIRFRWGPTDDEGSEHTIDYRRFAMELQAIHVKSGPRCDKGSDDDLCNSGNVIIISYVFQTTTIDNPYLDSMLLKFDRIKFPGSVVQIPPFPICWLMPAFVSDYYMYDGSLTYPPCTEGIQWIVQPEPLAISPRQVRKFRKLITKKSGRMLSNTRPIQCVNNRDIFYYTTCGECNCN